MFFRNVFDLMIQAGIKDPRTDAKFRAYLQAELQKIEDGTYTGSPQEGPVAPEEETPVETARKIRSSLRAIHESHSHSEKSLAMDYIFRQIEKKIDVDGINALTSLEVSKLTEIPKWQS